MTQLTTAEACIVLFDTVLEALAEIDAFSSPTSPSLFVVYAHDPDIYANSESVTEPKAFAETVKTLIAWLRKLRTRTLSDRHPMTLFEFESRDNGYSACRDILSNQVCVLPKVPDFEANSNCIRSVDRVIVCGSPRLESYCKDPIASSYVDVIHRVYDEYSQESEGDLREPMLRHALSPFSRLPGFHHVLTEIAFLEIRQQYDPIDHGIILLSLVEDMMDYLSFAEPTNLRLKFDATANTHKRHVQFFKLLRHIYPSEHATIEAFEQCYMRSHASLREFYHVVEEATLPSIVKTNIVNCQSELARHGNAEIRSLRQRLQIRDSLGVDDVGQAVDKIMQTLAPIPYEDRKNRNVKAVEGSCMWFKSHTVFQKWHKDESCDLLWVSAYPGCGKSVLLRHLVDDVLCAPNTIVCYFFFKQDFEDQRSVVDALRCILHQLWLTRRRLVTIEMVRQFETDQNVVKSPQKLWNLLLETSKGLTTEKLYVVLDALDECHGSERAELIQRLVEFNNHGSRNQSKPASRLKSLVSSRLYNDIRQGFSKIEAQIHLNGEGDDEIHEISEEINTVIGHRLDEICPDLGLTTEQQGLIHQALTKFHHKTYLWAHLVLEEIKNTYEFDTKSLLKIIDSLPHTVDEAYEKILSRSGNPTKVKKILHIIVAAYRPLSLSQFAEAWAVDQDVSSYHDLETDDEDQTRRMLQSLCGLFVVVVDKKVYLIHQTAREFLRARENQDQGAEDKKRFWKGSIELNQAHFTMAHICMSYLEIPDLPGDSLGIEVQQYDWPSKRSVTLGRGLNTLLSESDHTSESSDWLPAHDCGSESQDGSGPWKGPYGASEFAPSGKAPADGVFDELAEEGLDSESDWETWSSSSSRPPTPDYATETTRSSSTDLQPNYNGAPKEDILLQGEQMYRLRVPQLDLRQCSMAQDRRLSSDSLYVAHAATPTNNWWNWDYENPEIGGLVPFFTYAARFWVRHTRVSCKFEDDTSMMRAAKLCEPFSPQSEKWLLHSRTLMGDWQHPQDPQLVRLVKLELLEVLRYVLKNSTTDTEDRSRGGGGTPLILASKCGRLGMVELLLAKGAYINASDDYGMSALNWATENGHGHITQTLLSQGANTEFADEDGSTPLHRAAQFQNSHILPQFLDAGADMNKPDLLGRTPLMAAIHVGGLDDLEMLMQRAELFEADEYGFTLLGRAMTYGTPKVIEYLLQRGCQVDRPNTKGRTAFDEAVGNRRSFKRGLMKPFCVPDIELVQKHGGDINAVNPDGSTVLHRTLNSGNWLGFQDLLEYGADLEILNSKGQTMLHLAVMKNSLALVRVLLERMGRTDLERRDFDGRTLVDLALGLPVDYYSRKMICFLWQCGGRPGIYTPDKSRSVRLIEISGQRDGQWSQRWLLLYDSKGSQSSDIAIPVRSRGSWSSSPRFRWKTSKERTHPVKRSNLVTGENGTRAWRGGPLLWAVLDP